MEERVSKIMSVGAMVMLFIIFAGMLLIGALMVITTKDAWDAETTQDRYEVLDKNSYRYDADDMFLYIDEELGVGGVYYGTIPIGHFEIETKGVLSWKDRTFDTPSLVEKETVNNE